MKKKKLLMSIMMIAVLLISSITSFAASGSGSYGSKTVDAYASKRTYSIYGNTSVQPSGTATIRIRAYRRPTDGGVEVQLPESAHTQNNYVSLERSVGSGYIATRGTTYHGTDGNQYVVGLSV